MIGKEQAKAYEIMGADVKQTRRAVRQLGQVPALAGQGGEPEVLRRRVAGLLQGSRRPAAGGRHHQADAGHRRHHRHQLHQVARSPVSPVRLRGEGRGEGQPSRRRSKRLPLTLALSPRRGASRRRCASRESSMPRPLEPVSSPTRVLLGILFFVLFVLAWAWATFGGYVTRTFLADPLTMVHEGYELLVKHGFLLRHRHHHLARGGRLRRWRRWSPCRSAS